jgi:queuine tRNA-ribosyltransferase
MGWPRPILSDSGGFQIFSLLKESPNLGSVTKKGFRYRLDAGDKTRTLTPEKCIQRQFRLGADIIVALDYCSHPDAPPEQHRQSVEWTLDWGRACRREYDRLADQTGRRPLLFAAVQGGDDPALRGRCVEGLLEIGFDGYGFGGWPVDDEGRLREMVSHTAEIVPREFPLWGLGMGKPEGVVESVALGYDLFDCVIPTRDARRGRLFAFRGPSDQVSLASPDFYESVYIQDAKYIRAGVPIDEHCDCHCCRNYSRAYLRHLFDIRDSLSARLATLHNLRFYQRLMERLAVPGAPPRSSSSG